MAHFVSLPSRLPYHHHQFHCLWHSFQDSQMNKNLFTCLMPWINLLILTFCLFTNAFVGAVIDPYYLACVPRTCGNDQNISFPFYIRRSKAYCEYPGFEVSCNENNQPILNLTNGVDYNYIIHIISYTNQFFTVSNSAFSNHSETGLCIPPIQNFSLPSEKFELPKQDEALSLYSCQPTRIPNYEIGCSEENETNWVLGLPENDKDQLGNLFINCGNGTVVVAPVKGFSHGSVGIREVLSRGFDLKWKDGRCTLCRESGGFCGFNRTSYISRCYCPDRVHPTHCTSGESLFLSL